jgi:ankyrin repeat protein
VFEDYPELIELLVINGADINARDDEGETPLYKAVFKKHPESLKMLLEKNADPNLANNGGFTPLHLAASTGCSELAELLLDGGAKVNAKDGKGRTPLDVLQDKYCYSFTALMVRRGAVRKKRPADLIEAARYGEVREVQQFISTGVDVNAKDEYHAAALHYAVQLEDLTLCELLIDAGADVDIRSKYGTPLLIAAGRGNIDLMNLLVSRGTDVDASDNGWMALHGAVLKGHLQAAQYLLSEGAEVNARDSLGWTPLDWAMRTKNRELEKLLHSHGGKTWEELAREQERPGSDRSEEQR